jgi:hypothetical protein
MADLTIFDIAITVVTVALTGLSAAALTIVWPAASENPIGRRLRWLLVWMCVAFGYVAIGDLLLTLVGSDLLIQRPLRPLVVRTSVLIGLWGFVWLSWLRGNRV